MDIFLSLQFHMETVIRYLWIKIEDEILSTNSLKRIKSIKANQTSQHYGEADAVKPQLFRSPKRININPITGSCTLLKYKFW